jgi:hypothetical protein
MKETHRNIDKKHLKLVLLKTIRFMNVSINLHESGTEEIFSKFSESREISMKKKKLAQKEQL